MVGDLEEPLGKHSNNKHIDDEGGEEGNTRLNEEIFVGFFHLLFFRPVHFSRLFEREVRMFRRRNKVSGLVESVSGKGRKINKLQYKRVNRAEQSIIYMHDILANIYTRHH